MSVAQLSPRDDDPLPIGRACAWWEGRAAVLLHALELVLLGWLCVHNRVFVDVLLKDHGLWRKMEKYQKASLWNNAHTRKEITPTTFQLKCILLWQMISLNRKKEKNCYIYCLLQVLVVRVSFLINHFYIKLMINKYMNFIYNCTNDIHKQRVF